MELVIIISDGTDIGHSHHCREFSGTVLGWTS